VGSGPDCAIQIPEEQLRADRLGATGAQARVWMRDGRLVVHHLAPSPNETGGAPATWTTLEPGDEAQVGDYLLRYTGPVASGASPNHAVQ
jgi:hypothetical protein